MNFELTELVVMSSTDPANEHQLILRLPQDCASQVREALKADTLGERLQLEFHSQFKFDMHHSKVTVAMIQRTHWVP